jgi:perosamine synthetase
MFVPASPVLDAAAVGRKPTESFDVWLPRGATYLLPSGRSAIRAALLKLKVEGATALLPSYLCESVLSPFQSAGCNVLFYGVGRDLAPDLEEVERVLKTRRVRILLIIHYFGFPLPLFSRLRLLCDEHGVLLIEDCAHALFSQWNGQPLGSAADATVFSFRKSLPIPEGGALVIRNDPDTQPIRSTFKLSELTSLAREIVYWMEFHAGFSVRNIALSISWLRNWSYDRNAQISSFPDLPIGSASSLLLRYVNVKRIVQARRRNFGYWLSRMNDLGCSAIFRELPDGVCPIGFPILIEHRDQILPVLYRNGIALRTFWDRLPVQIDTQRFPDADYLRERIAVLPVHQTLSTNHLDYVFTAISKCLNS